MTADEQANEQRENAARVEYHHALRKKRCPKCGGRRSVKTLRIFQGCTRCSYVAGNRQRAREVKPETLIDFGAKP